MIKNMENQHPKQTKQSLRNRIKEMKRSMPEKEIDEKSNKILEKLISIPEYEISERIYAYVSYNQEVSTAGFIKKAISDGKCVLVPKVYGDIMRYHIIKSFDELKPGAYGILEPDNDMTDDVYEGFMLLPGLAFDEKKHRMGYGGGFYDKYLSGHKKHFKAALAYDFQVFDSIPAEEYDVPADIIVTEERIIR